MIIPLRRTASVHLWYRATAYYIHLPFRQKDSAKIAPRSLPKPSPLWYAAKILCGFKCSPRKDGIPSSRRCCVYFVKPVAEQNVSKQPLFPQLQSKRFCNYHMPQLRIVSIFRRIKLFLHNKALPLPFQV